ncbi:hypothetical protein AB0D08_39255 [Kitasatospora sp. NPDC048540]|uniref:hypothetical protein n=1 Tax=Kitasatospora sp. NPDC048540 TaxID=3155634 RepID=UPI0033F2DCB4
MSDPGTSDNKRTVGDTTYSWISTAVGDILYATRASGWRERLLMGPSVREVFASLTQRPYTDPLEQLRHEQHTLDQVRQNEAAQREQARDATEDRELQRALDDGTISPETYVRGLADQAARRAAPPPSLRQRLDDHRLLARLERDLRIGRVGPILDAAGRERTPGTDTGALDDLEAHWHDDHTRPTAKPPPQWTERPHGRLSHADLARQLAGLTQAVPNLRNQAKAAEVAAAALTTDAAQGRGPAARAVRQGEQDARTATQEARDAARGFRSANAHLRRSLALHRAADDATGRSEAGSAYLLLRATTPAAQRDGAQRLREQAVRAKLEADGALARATAALTRARALRATAPHQQWGPSAAGRSLEAAIASDLHAVEAQSADLRSSAARLRTKADGLQDRLDQLRAETEVRSSLTSRQRRAEDREREVQHRQRAVQGEATRTGRPAERHRRAGRRPPAPGPSPT